MLHYGLEISSQSLAGRIKVEGFKRSSSRKLQSEDSVVTEMAAVHFFHATSKVTSPVKDTLYYQSNPIFRLFRQGDEMQLK